MSSNLDGVLDQKHNDFLKDEAAVLKSIGHFVRLKLLLAIEMKRCMVKGLVDCVQEEQPIVSQQLAVLKKSKIIEGTKKGNTIYYKIIDPTVKQVITLLAEKYAK